MGGTLNFVLCHGVCLRVRVHVHVHVYTHARML